MGWLIALGILFALAILHVGVFVSYDSEGPLACLVIGPFKVRLYPTNPQKNEKKKKAENKQTSIKNTSDGTKDKKKKQSGGSWKDFIPLVRVALDFLASFGRKLRVKQLYLKIIMGGGDPCDLAVNYGKAWTAIGSLLPLLENVFTIQNRNLEVECDFTAEETLVVARLDLRIAIGHLIGISLWHGLRAVYHYLNIMNMRKGGASK